MVMFCKCCCACHASTFHAQLRRLLGKRFDETWLPTFAGVVWDQLSEYDKSNIAKFLRDRPEQYKWGSACSGSDSPAWVFDALKPLFRDNNMKCCGEEFAPVHIYSAEKVPFKRDFILRLPFGPPRHLFPCLFQLSSSVSHECVITNKRIQASNLRVCTLLAGFSCTSASFLNTRETGNVVTAANIQATDSLGQTAVTFNGVCLILQRRDSQ